MLSLSGWPLWVLGPHSQLEEGIQEVLTAAQTSRSQFPSRTNSVASRVLRHGPGGRPPGEEATAQVQPGLALWEHRVSLHSTQVWAGRKEDWARWQRRVSPGTRVREPFSMFPKEQETPCPVCAVLSGPFREGDHLPWHLQCLVNAPHLAPPHPQPCPELALAFLPTCVPAPRLGPGIGEAAKRWIQELAQGLCRGGARILLDPLEGEYFVFCLSVQSL